MERFELDFVWRGFELHPEIPPGGMDLGRMFPEDAIERMHGRLKEVAAGMGISFDPPRHAPSTRRALALAELARREGVLDAFRDGAMHAHWVDHRDIEDVDVLAGIAEESGLDADRARAFLSDPQVPGLLRDQRVEAQRWGVTGIPTWFMLPAGWTPADGVPDQGPRPVKVVGCQPLEVVERAARMAGAVERG